MNPEQLANISRIQADCAALEKHALILLWIYVAMGAISILATVTIGFFGTSLRGAVRALGFASALAIGLITAFSLGESAGRMREAATKLRAAIFTFDADRQAPKAYKDLVHEWELAQTVVGNVSFKPPNSGNQAALASTAKMYAAADATSTETGPNSSTKGQIADVKPESNSVTITWADKQVAKPHMPLTVVRDGKTIGQLRITGSDSDKSYAEIVTGSTSTGTPIKKGDEVVATMIPDKQSPTDFRVVTPL